MKVEDIVKGRIKENTNLFTKEELNMIKGNYILISKIYMLGIVDNIIIDKRKF